MSPYLASQQARNDFERKIKEASEKPSRAGREGSSSEDWLEVHIDEGGEVVSADEARPLHERVWSFIDTYCNIL